MIGNAKSMKAGGKPKNGLPTLEDVDKGLVTLDAFEAAHGEDVAELTEADLQKALPVTDVPELLQMFEKARGQRGPQKAPIKERIGLRVDKNVVEFFRQTGPGWQSRMNDVLADYVKAGGK